MDNNEVPPLCTLNLLTGFQSQLVYSAISLLVLLACWFCITRQPTTLTQMCEWLPLMPGTLLCWPNLQQETCLQLRPNTIKTVYVHCTTEPGRRHPRAMMEWNLAFSSPFSSSAEHSVYNTCPCPGTGPTDAPGGSYPSQHSRQQDCRSPASDALQERMHSHLPCRGRGATSTSSGMKCELGQAGDCWPSSRGCKH